MAYQFDKNTGEIVISGWENGIAQSPHKGIGNLQGVNISTEPGEVMASFARFQQSQKTITNGTFSAGSSTIVVYSGQPRLFTGWVNISSSTISGLSTGNYWVSPNGGGNSQFFLYNQYGSATNITGLGNTGTATFSTINMGKPVQACTEQYNDSSNNAQYRYYVMDTSGLVWVYDTAIANNAGFWNDLFWSLIDPTVIAPNGNAGGLAVFCGYLHAFVENTINVKETVLLGQNSLGSLGWDTMTQALNTGIGSKNSHYAIVTQQNTLAYCDGPFLGTITASSNSGSAATAPIWSYGSSTYSGTTFSISGLLGGSLPLANSTITFTTTGTFPTGISANTRYYVLSVNKGASPITFTIAATVGGSAISVSGGSGTLYFNTYNPVIASGNNGSYINSLTALSLPFNNISQCLSEIGNQIVIGCNTNVLYFWDEISPLPTNFIPLPETNVQLMVNVNNMAYVFAGAKGNIYVTNGSTASLAMSVPDYCAKTVEPYFVWGGGMYLRGRVFFSIQDQTSSKTGNCGGVWSFVPVQNFFIGQDVGLSLRMENQNSYATYNGVANILLPSRNQNANGPQFWSAWTSDVSSPTYGIDNSDTKVFTNAIIETDIVPVGRYIDPQNYAGIEYKLSSPLLSGESITINYRTNLNFGSFTLAGTDMFTTAPQGKLANRFPVPFANVLWVQFQAVLAPNATTASSSFGRLKELRIYKRV